MGECTHDCSSCSEKCSERTIPKEKLNELSKVKKVIGIVSGKGGVGKSFVTSLLALTAQNKGFNSAILDADITGPSIPKFFGLNERAESVDGKYLMPVSSKNGTKVMSINLLLASETEPVVWRGPVIAGAVKQFWTDVNWGDVDYMFVDMPPGTGDVPLTVFQSLPVDGIIVVTSPSKLVSMIVEKAVNMARLMSIPVIGVVENMSYFKCPKCGETYDIFGKSDIDNTAMDFGISKTAKVPIDPKITELADSGKIEDISTSYLEDMFDHIVKFVK